MRARFSIVILVIIAASASAGGTSFPADAQTVAPASALTGATSILVRAQDAAPLDEIARHVSLRGYAVTSSADALHAVEVALPPTGNLPRAIADLSSIPGVAYVEPVYASFDAADNPADPLYSRSRSYLDAINAPAAWDIEQGSPGTIVAVVDSGVDLEHPDLAGRIWTNAGEIPDNGIDDDGNGCGDDVHGCALIVTAAPGCDLALYGTVDDDYGHGTFVAGIIAANANGEGMVGVARNVTIMPVKVLDCEGRGNSLSLAQGIFYAARAGADIINVSIGGPVDSIVVREAVRVATETHGALIVASAGNSGKSGVTYPARYPQVLAVGAASSSDPDKRAKFSTYGAEVDVVAVGEKVIGTVPAETCDSGAFLRCIDGNYGFGDGTSFSSPQVAGLAALIVSRRPGITPAAIIELIKSTATAVPPGDRATWAGAGRIDMLAALRPPFRLGAPGVAKQ